MKLDSVRELKATLVSSQLAALAAARPDELAIAARPVSALETVPRTIALGVAPAGKNRYKLAVRVQNRALAGSPEVQTIVKQAKKEVDVRHIGRVVKRAAPFLQRRRRPLVIGCSIGHHLITAGTLGCFVRAADGTLLVLSNNHVLANENDAAPGDAILQQGRIDGGTLSRSRVGKLARFAAIKFGGAVNLVDAATASINDGINSRLTPLRDLGTLAGLGPAEVFPGDAVAKVGRTTATTHGTVTAFELDNVVVAYDNGNARFDDQIEIESTGNGPFSLGGDSGSLIVDADLRGVALLFAGSDQGGSNGLGLTFANPIHTVLEKLKVSLAT
jgi:hypothetical protein